MLQFIFGCAASGKTFKILELIKQAVENGEKPVLIVPEQFSFESEKAVLELLGDKDAQKVYVTSFSRLCDESERRNGGICGTKLTDSDKLIFISQAIKDSKNDLLLWNRYTSSSGFAVKMLEAITEFKMNCITAGDLLDAASEVDGTLSLKLHDTAVIYEMFDCLISEKFIDPADRLTKLYHTLETDSFFNDKTVFFDSFKGFTGQQFKITERIISNAENTTLSFTDSPEDMRQYGVFSNIRKTSQKIRNYALSHGIKIANDVILPENKNVSEDIRNIERVMSAKELTQEKPVCNSVTVCKASSYSDEAEFCARNIRKTVRENEAQYSDFVIIARDTSLYEQPLETALKRNGINCFIDKRIPLSALPAAVAVTSAMESAKNFSTENILQFLKSGISLLNTEEISILENYTYLWNIDSSLWETEWTMNPSGMNYGDEENAENTKKLKTINELRKRAFEPIYNFKKNFKGTAEKMARAIMQLLEVCNARQSLKALSSEYIASGQTVYSDALKQSWEYLCNLLDSTVKCIGNRNISVSDFSDILKTSFDMTTVGVIPQTADQVTFGAADRIRPSRPKFAFILGANQGVFPKVVNSAGLFSSLDRERLISLCLDIPDKTIGSAIDEEFLAYSNVCCPTQGLFISYCADEQSGYSKPSSFVTEILSKLKCNEVTEPQKLCFDNLPETYASAFTEFCKKMPTDKNDAVTISDALKDNKEFFQKTERIKESSKIPSFSITPETACGLFGRDIYMSPSKFDTLSKCRFSFFCKYGIKAKALQPAKFDVMQRGTLIHFVLQMMIEKYGKGIAKLSYKEICNKVEFFTEEYLNGIKGYREIETENLKFMVFTMKRSLEDIVLRLKEEFAQTDFEPVKCELEISDGKDIPALKIPIKDYGNIYLNGKIDRLDKWNGYIRIIDYKTGSKVFRLPDILFGQNMQMLLYLYAVCADENFGGKPAGILYFPARRLKNLQKSQLRMNGMLSDSEEVNTAMEKYTKGQFVPCVTNARSKASFINEKDFYTIFDYINKKLSAAGKALLGGEIGANPVDSKESACEYCDFAAICRISKEAHPVVPVLTNNQVIEEIERQVQENEL